MTSSNDDMNDATRSHFFLTKDTVIGHYRITEKIGAGGMGEVYLAEDTELNRKVALKFLPLHLCRDADCRARFKREAQAAAKLGHANIVAVYEVGEHQGRPFFAMELVEGSPLDKIVTSGRLNQDEIVELALGICNGLRKAHDSGIIHRDIKPSNIIVDHDNIPRVLDFGLAVIRDSDRLTQDGLTPGTIGYMSPEQIAGREADARSDLFSLGVVLYELITGVNPFRRDNQAATLMAISEDLPEPPGRRRSGISEELQRIVAKLLEKKPEHRYQTAADLGADLRRLKNPAESAISRVRTRWYIAAILTLIIISALGLGYVLKNKAPSGSARKMLAVLPFENLGAPEDEYFADGITDEIITALAGLSGLGVISRTSSMQYRHTDKSLKQIGKELGVDYILEGTIHWERKGSESRVRINPYLIRVSDDSHLWVSRYNAVLTDVFEVQSTIAQEVAAALDVTLMQAEQEVLSRKTEIDPRAYDYYLRGKRFFSVVRYKQNEMPLAEMMHLKAIELAPDFAQAYAELGSLYTEMYWDRTDPSQQRLDSAIMFIDKALRLAPNMPEAHQARGWYYYHGLRDYKGALQEFSRVLELQPNNALAIASVAWVERRQGKWDEATAGLQAVVKLDPLDAWYRYELGITYLYCHRYSDAIAQFDRAIDMQPNHLWAYILKSWAILNQTGETGQAREVLDAGRACNGRWPELNWLEAYYDLCDKNYDHALRLITSPGEVFFPDHPDSSDYYSLRGLAYSLMGQRQVAAVYYDSARVWLESRLSLTPDNAPILSSLASVYAGLGQSSMAIQMAKRAADINPISEDALSGPDYIRVLAMVYAQAGQQDQAIELFDYLLSIPSNLSVIILKLTPELSSLRDNPRFLAVLENHKSIQ